MFSSISPIQVNGKNPATLAKQVLSGTLLWWEMKKATQKWSRMSPYQGTQHLQGKEDTVLTDQELEVQEEN